jgi:hypothetical protein
MRTRNYSKVLARLLGCVQGWLKTLVVVVSGLRARAGQINSFHNKQVENVMCYLRCLNEASDDSSFAI